MRIFRCAEAPTGPGDPKTFTGSARTTRLASDDTATPVHVYRVAFEQGGRTNWHTHSGPQWIFVTDGRIRVQVWGQPPQDVAEGDAVLIAPGEKHWHGAAPGSQGIHVAVNINLKTEWLEPVSDAEYGH